MIDELDKIHPKSGASRSPRSRTATSRPTTSGTPRSRTISPARGAERVRGLPGRDPGAAARPGAGPASELTFDDAAGGRSRSRYGRYHPVPTPEGPLPDPIVPLGVACADPSTASRQTRACTSSFTCPTTPRPGRTGARLTLTLGAEQPSPAGEPDGLGLHPARPPQLPARDELLRAARGRAGVLPPGPSPPDGPQPPAVQPERPRSQEGCAPRLGRPSGSTGPTWDRRFGPLLDGSAFADLPRKGVPVECFYLPLHENWPSPMEGNYNGGYWADQAFPESYRRAFVSASRQIAEHFRDRAGTTRSSTGS